MFRGDKSHLGNKRVWVYTSEAMQAKTFMEFIALIIWRRLYACLRGQVQKEWKEGVYDYFGSDSGTGKDRGGPPE